MCYRRFGLVVPITNLRCWLLDIVAVDVLLDVDVLGRGGRRRGSVLMARFDETLQAEAATAGSRRPSASPQPERTIFTAGVIGVAGGRRPTQAAGGAPARHHRPYVDDRL